MLQKKHRLSKKQFDLIISGGRAVHSPLFTFVYVTNHEKSMGLVAVAPKKIAKSAVERNSIRRKIYGSLGRVLGKSIIPVHGIFLAKPSVVSTEFRKIDENIKQIFVKLGLLK